MRILCVIDSLGSGGAQRQLVNLAVAFKERGHQVRFAVYHQENFFKGLLDEQYIKVDVISEPSYVKRLFKFRKYIRKGNFDAVLSFLEAANFICEFAGLPWKRWTLVVGERSANPNILKSFKLKFYRWFHLFSDFVVSNSYENLKLVKQINPLLSSGKGKVIYNMVDFDHWSIDNEYVPLRDGKLLLIVVASHRYLKNAKGLIEAVEGLRDEEKQKIKIEWYGNVSLDNSNKEAINLVHKYSLEHIITFHKATLAINQKMKKADAIGLFSFYEGLPNVLCEAMVMGKPIVTSAVSDIPLLIKDKQLLFNPYDTDDISKVLSYLISLKAEELLELGERNKMMNKKLFYKEAIVSEYLSLLEH